MIEIQCTSCHTRYRIDERVLPDDTPTFKCSRCGHVFNADPVPAKVRKAALARAVEPQQPRARSRRAPPPRRVKPSRSRRSKAATSSRAVASRGVCPRSEARARAESEADAEPDRSSSRDRRPRVRQTDAGCAPEDRPAEDPDEPKPTIRSIAPFGDRDQKADTGENLRFDFSRRAQDEVEKDLADRDGGDADSRWPESDGGSRWASVRLSTNPRRVRNRRRR